MTWGLTRRPLGPIEGVARTDREKYALRGASGSGRIGWAVLAAMLAAFSLGAGFTDAYEIRPEAVRTALAFLMFAGFFWEGALIFRVIERLDGMLRQSGPPAARSLGEVCRTRSERVATGFARLRPGLPLAVASVALGVPAFAAVWLAPGSILAEWVLFAMCFMIWMCESYLLTRILDRLVAKLRERVPTTESVS